MSTSQRERVLAGSGGPDSSVAPGGTAARGDQAARDLAAR